MKIGTPLSSGAVKAVLLGSGELGKEVVIELQRFGIEVIACDRYENAPAMQVAHRSAVFDMLDGKKIRDLVYREKPDLIIPEIEAIDTETLLELENEGYRVIPSAKAARLTMDREGIRRLAAEQLGLLTSPYRFADSLEEFRAALKEIGIPCVVKPVMSSSGKGQSVIRSESEADAAFEYAMKGGRAKKNRIIIEGFIDFDFEITLLTLRHSGGTSFCEPIGHIQIDGDYRESWQPQPMSEAALKASKETAAGVTEALGGYGIFGVELFVKGDTVYFSEVSPRPHDTGLVTLVSQDLSEFALHARAVLGLPVPEIRTLAPSASYAFLVEGDSRNIFYTGAEKALSIPGVSLRLFGKPSVEGKRRMGVVLATGKNTAEARKKAEEAVSHLKAELL